MSDSSVISSIICASAMFCYTYFLSTKVNNVEMRLIQLLTHFDGYNADETESNTEESLDEEVDEEVEEEVEEELEEELEVEEKEHSFDDKNLLADLGYPKDDKEITIDDIFYQVSAITYEISRLKKSAARLDREEYEKYALESLFTEIDKLYSEDNENGFHRLLDRYQT
jgi:hypothetical protein